MKWLGKYTEHAYALLRIVAGFNFSIHGAQKILGLWTDQQPPMWSQGWFGGIIELVGGLAIMLGLKTRWAAFLCSGTMAVAYFQFHSKFQGGSMALPVINRGELAVIYCFLFLFFACRGSGKWSLDKSN